MPGALLATYAGAGGRHRIELVRTGDGALVIDRPPGGTPLVVAELAADEGREQALAALHEGGYLDRAGEPGLCRALADDKAAGRSARRRAA